MMFNKNARKYIIKVSYIFRVRLRWNAERAEPKKAKKGNDWGFAPNPTRNLRFLDFPIRFAAA